MGLACKISKKNHIKIMSINEAAAALLDCSILTTGHLSESQVSTNSLTCFNTVSTCILLSSSTSSLEWHTPISISVHSTDSVIKLHDLRAIKSGFVPSSPCLATTV